MIVVVLLSVIDISWLILTDLSATQGEHTCPHNHGPRPTCAQTAPTGSVLILYDCFLSLSNFHVICTALLSEVSIREGFAMSTCSDFLVVLCCVMLYCVILCVVLCGVCFCVCVVVSIDVTFQRPIYHQLCRATGLLVPVTAVLFVVVVVVVIVVLVFAASDAYCCVAYCVLLFASLVQLTCSVTEITYVAPCLSVCL